MPATPNIARVWDHWLGGHLACDVDRAAAKRIEETVPSAPAMAVRSRQFLGRAVTWVTRQGVIQFLDLGAGIPTRAEAKLPGGKTVRVRPVHELAREVAPHARAAYVDNDEVAVSQCLALLSGPGVAVVGADLRDPGAVLAGPALEVLDMSRPIALVLSCVLHYFSPDAAREITAGYARLVPPGSYVILSAIACEPGMLGRLREEAAGRHPVDVNSFTPDEIGALFRGLELVEPGIVPARAWRGGAPDPGLRPRGPVYLLAGVGRKTLLVARPVIPCADTGSRRVARRVP
ncbi:MAG TPA: SAM-dependent methyltransferase [Streptosporangiaceae bacterium]|nr:SAM-dependent methyltransferase [Streptosporangiaceae bacterium]